MEIARATSEHVEEVSGLFDLYRQFYACEPDRDLARSFIVERIETGESIVFVALEGQVAHGFVQLYPSFCSVSAIKILILYDLYVVADRRRHGLGKALMNRATAFAMECEARRIDLLTGVENTRGQRLYEKLGYKRSLDDFIGYALDVE